MGLDMGACRMKRARRTVRGKTGGRQKPILDFRANLLPLLISLSRASASK